MRLWRHVTYVGVAGHVYRRTFRMSIYITCEEMGVSLGQMKVRDRKRTLWEEMKCCDARESRVFLDSTIEEEINLFNRRKYGVLTQECPSNLTVLD